MQPGTNPEDIHTILSRFDRWAGKENASSNGHARKLESLDAGVREIPYEEAMRMMRSRRGGVARAATAPAVSEIPQAVADAAPKAEPPKPTALDTALEIKVRSTEKSMRRVLGKAPEAKKSAKAAAPAPKKQPRAQERKLEAAIPQEFRQVLAKTVRKPAARPAVTKEKGRDQRVSVRLSRAEEHRLQTLAAKAGVTVSEYLRMRALESGAEPGASATATSTARSERTIVETSPAVTRPAKSGLGDWLALLRNRFLASPGRFAERA